MCVCVCQSYLLKICVFFFCSCTMHITYVLFHNAYTTSLPARNKHNRRCGARVVLQTRRERAWGFRCFTLRAGRSKLIIKNEYSGGKMKEERRNEHNYLLRFRCFVRSDPYDWFCLKGRKKATRFVCVCVCVGVWNTTIVLFFS